MKETTIKVFSLCTLVTRLIRPNVFVIKFSTMLQIRTWEYLVSPDYDLVQSTIVVSNAVLQYLAKRDRCYLSVVFTEKQVLPCDPFGEHESESALSCRTGYG